MKKQHYHQGFGEDCAEMSSRLTTAPTMMAANAERNVQNLGWTHGDKQFSDLTRAQYRVAGRWSQLQNACRHNGRYAICAERSMSCFSELFVDTTNFMGKLCDDHGGNGEDVLRSSKSVVAQVRLWCHCLTRLMDFNPHFIKYCREVVSEE